MRVFVRIAWPLVEPTQPFTTNWHIDALCDVLESVTRGDIDRLIVNIPPGCMKTLLVSVFWPAWEWASDPSLRYLTASYSSGRTIDANMKLRQIVTSEWFQTHYGCRISSDQNAKERFDTTAGGWRIATSVSPSGLGTGLHPDRIVVDDPQTAEQATSEIERASATRWYTGTISSRGIVRKVRVVVVMQRLHELDVSGYLLNMGGWTHLCWPMRYEPSRPGLYDPRTEPGQLLWPALFPESVVKPLEYTLGPYGTAGQLQQRPSPEGGGLFKAAWFEFVDQAPVNAERIRGWDTAATAGAGDYTVGVKIAHAHGTFYIEDVKRGQWSPMEVEQEMLAAARADGVLCKQREEKEGGASGKAIYHYRARTMAGFDYAMVQIDKKKELRAGPFRAQCEAGHVKLVRGAWNHAYLQELCAFPTGQHDDQVDASSAAFNELVRPSKAIATIGQGRDISWQDRFYGR